MTQAPRISIASVVHDRLVADQYLLRSLEALEEPAQTLLLSNADNALTTNLASLYNVLLRLDGPARRAFVHPDVTFDPDLVARLSGAVDDLEAAGSPWGAVGIVGRAWEGDYVWGHEIDAPRPVCTLDSCFVLTRTDLGLAFDASASTSSTASSRTTAFSATPRAEACGSCPWPHGMRAPRTTSSARAGAGTTATGSSSTRSGADDSRT